MSKQSRRSVRSDLAPSLDQWVLGFDGGCAACSKLAREVEEIAGDRLVSRSLADPQVRAWREQALGPDAVWEPTLFRVSEDDVQVWIGRAMSWRLTRLVGPKAAYRIARVIAHLDEEQVDIPNPGRRAFVRRAGGVVIGAGLLAVGPRALALAKGSELSGTSMQLRDGGSVTSLPETDPVINQLMTSRTVANAASQFGAVDRGNVSRVITGDGAIGYVLPLGATAFLSLVDPGSTLGNGGVVGRVGKDPTGNTSITWYSPNGAQITETSFIGDRLIALDQNSAEAVPATAEPDAITKACWDTCLGDAYYDFAFCYSACSKCTAPLSAQCLLCYGCAGALGVYCAIHCAGSNGGGGGGGCGGCETSSREDKALQ